MSRQLPLKVSLETSLHCGRSCDERRWLNVVPVTGQLQSPFNAEGRSAKRHDGVGIAPFFKAGCSGKPEKTITANGGKPLMGNSELFTILKMWIDLVFGGG
jgi:hypothetical protein